MIRPALLAAALALALPFVATAAEPVDLGPGVSDYQRFMAYPHLQRGLDALKRGDVAAAVAAFERARSYAPKSATTALYLADAYRRAGRGADAERVLAEQRRYTPNDRRFARAPAVATPVAPARSAPAVVPPDVVVPAAPVAIVTAPSASIPSKAAPAPRALTPEQSLRLGREVERALATADIKRAEALLADVPNSSFSEARLALDLARGRLGEASARARAILREAPRDAALLDRVTFRLVNARQNDVAVRLMLDTWPTSASSLELANRLAGLLAAGPSALSNADRARLNDPLSGPVATAAQAIVLVAAGDCAAAGNVLGRAPDGTSGTAWLALAGCESGDASLDALRIAVARGAGTDASRRLAYAAYEAGDFQGALEAWRSIPSDELDSAQLLAAAQTAVDAQHSADAVRWLDAYARRGGTQNDAYWWLRAQVAPRGSADERAAIERALASHEDPRYLARLAQLQTADGDHEGAVRSLERAHALAPDDVSIGASLGYALLAVERPADALPLLAAYRARHTREVPIAEDLAEIHRRLVQPEQAREAARSAVDLLGAEADPDRQFRLRRLHEQLGRDWAFSGDVTLGDSVSNANATVPGASYRSYGQVEADRWLGHRIGRPDGDALAVYARVFAGAQTGGILPDDLPTLGVGVRWKPFETRIAYIALEHQLALDARDVREDDTLIRVSAAPITNPVIGQDWHASGTGWWSHVVYLDAAHYIRSGDSAATADYQIGRHFKRGEGDTIEPYGRAQWNGRWQDGGFDTDTRFGLGIRWNHWYGGDRYDAWPHRWVLGVEVQQAVTTYLPERQTALVNFGSYW